jgi:hypothetical protein
MRRGKTGPKASHQEQLRHQQPTPIFFSIDAMRYSFLNPNASGFMLVIHNLI